MIMRACRWNVIPSMALVALTCVDLTSCGGGGSRRTSPVDDQMMIQPRPPPASQGTPDLAVQAPTVSEASPAAGETFTLSATVRNLGDGEAATTTLRWYRSPDATITTTDTAVGAVAVGALAPSGRDGASLELTAPSNLGTYYYGACVDTVANESNLTNNCSASVPVAVSEPQAEQGDPVTPQRRPDLMVLGVFLASGALDGSPGRSITFRSMIRNQGDVESAATTLRWFRSPEATITTTDTEVGSVAVGPLTASGGTSGELLFSLTAPATPGTYYYGACVDAVTNESDTTNNCSASLTVTVEEPAPDLVVRAPEVSDSNPPAGETFTLSATVRNQGDGESPATTLHFYRSLDATVSTSDTAVGTDAVGALAASGTSSESVDLTAPSTPGTYYYGACVDAVANESDTTNNCSSSVQVRVTEQQQFDLAVSVSSVNQDGTREAGERFSLRITVSNDGNVRTPATFLRNYRSMGSWIADIRTQVARYRFSALNPESSRSLLYSFTAPSTPGTYYYGTCVDMAPGESDTTNNCSSPVMITVVSP